MQQRKIAKLERELFLTRKRAAKKLYKIRQYNNLLINQTLVKYYSEDTRYKWVLRNAGAVTFYQHFKNDPVRVAKFREILKIRKWYGEPHLLFAEYQQKFSYRYGLLVNPPPSFYNNPFSRRLP